MREKSEQILVELGGKEVVGVFHHAPDAIKRIARAFRHKLNAANARELGYHCSDWNYDAAFLVALHANPGRFTNAEIREGISQILIHTPWHIGEAGKILCDYIYGCKPNRPGKKPAPRERTKTRTV